MSIRISGHSCRMSGVEPPSRRMTLLERGRRDQRGLVLTEEESWRLREPSVKQGRSQGQGAREGALDQGVDYPSDMSRGVGGAFA